MLSILLPFPQRMNPILFTLESRRVRYSGTRCYNERNQPISCPMSRAELIVIAVILILFALICLFVFCVTRCGLCCSCRRRRKTLYPMDAEIRAAGPYQPLHSLETLVAPEKIHPAVHPYHHY